MKSCSKLLAYIFAYVSAGSPYFFAYVFLYVQLLSAVCCCRCRCRSTAAAAACCFWLLAAAKCTTVPKNGPPRLVAVFVPFCLRLLTFFKVFWRGLFSETLDPTL